MHTYSTQPKDNNNDHFYNYYKGNNDDNGLGLHINTLSLGFDFQQQRQQPNDLTLLDSCEPPLTPNGSPSSSSSSAATSPAIKDSGVYIPHTHHRVARNKSTITRKTSAPSPQVTCQSWEHLKSPAASFLASFASPTTSGSNTSSAESTSTTTSTTTSTHRPSLSTFFEEQQGDEIDDYVMNQIIGYGGFSTVRKGYCISNGQTVAIKIIRKNGQESTLEQELEVWQTLDHDNVVRIQKVLETDYATYVVCDYCANGTLLQHLLSHSLNLCEKKRLFSQLCSVVDYLHRKCNVIHKDIKLDNILLDDDMNIKLCDFGLAVYQRHSVAPTHLAQVARPGSPLSPPSTTTTCAVGGSLAYCAPEQIKASYVLTCPKTDVWSLGVVLFAMFAGRLPFDDDYDVRLRSTILNGHYQIPDTFSSPLADLISHCLQSDPSQRYSLDQVMNHPWLK